MEGTQVQTTKVELKQRFIVGRMTSVGNKQEGDVRGWTIGRQGCRQVEEHTGWMAGRGAHRVDGG
jgi:hypothetical protein